MSSGFLYFMREKGQESPVKIGFSSNPPTRLRQYQMWSPRKLEIFLTVPAKSRDEYNAHCLCADSHSHHEWFHLSPFLKSCIERLRAGEAADAVFFGTSRDHPIMSKSRNPRKKQSPAQRQGMSYNSRMWRTQRRTGFAPPSAIKDRYEAWDRNKKNAGEMLPHDLQQSLDRYLKEPERFGVALPYEWAIKLHGIEAAA